MEAVDVVLSALADPTRRQILETLSRGEASATRLSEHLPVSRQAVVKHLGVLERAGLVDARRRGREVCFEVRTAPLSETARWMGALAEEWDRRLTAIRQLAEALGDEAGRD
jgi:DNA-binding transcriptional ArsR family regulator